MKLLLLRKGRNEPPSRSSGGYAIAGGVPVEISAVHSDAHDLSTNDPSPHLTPNLLQTLQHATRHCSPLLLLLPFSRIETATQGGRRNLETTTSGDAFVGASRLYEKKFLGKTRKKKLNK